MTQAYNLSQLANNLNSSGQLDATDGLVNAVPIANGGTGASSIAAAVSNLSASIYPVGSIYINASVSTNPGILFGFGTWVSFGTGRVLVGVDAGDTAFDTLGETGGTKDAVVVSHTHAATTAIIDPGHNHSVTMGYTDLDSSYIGGGRPGPWGTLYVNNNTTGITATTSLTSTGSSGTNANLQPYITVYMWKRTA